MNVAARRRIMEIEDFLAWEARQEGRWEFDGFEPLAMVGGSRDHARVQTNLAVAFGGRLRGTRCEFLGSDMKVLLPDRVRYPDGQIICGRTEGRATFTTTPTVIFEVVSPSSAGLDHTEKAVDYRGLASLRHYVILQQDRAAGLMHSRAADGGWTTTILDASQNLVLPEVGISVPMAELYEGIGTTA